MMRHSRYTKTVELRYLVYLGIADVDNASTSVKSCPGVSLRRAWAHDVPPNQMIRSGSHHIYMYIYIVISRDWKGFKIGLVPIASRYVDDDDDDDDDDYYYYINVYKCI